MLDRQAVSRMCRDETNMREKPIKISNTKRI